MGQSFRVAVIHDMVDLDSLVGEVVGAADIGGSVFFVVQFHGVQKGAAATAAQLQNLFAAVLEPVEKFNDLLILLVLGEKISVLSTSVIALDADGIGIVPLDVEDRFL